MQIQLSSVTFRIFAQTIVLFFIFNDAFAEPNASTASAPASTSLMIELLRSLIALVIVISALVLTLWIIKRVKKLPNRKSLMHVEDSLAVGTRESLAIVRVGEQRFLLGITTQQVSCLATLAKDDLTTQAPTDSNA